MRRIRDLRQIRNGTWRERRSSASRRTGGREVEGDEQRGDEEERMIRSQMDEMDDSEFEDGVGMDNAESTRTDEDISLVTALQMYTSATPSSSNATSSARPNPYSLPTVYDLTRLPPSVDRTTIRFPTLSGYAPLPFPAGNRNGIPNPTHTASYPWTNEHPGYTSRGTGPTNVYQSNSIYFPLDPSDPRDLLGLDWDEVSSGASFCCFFFFFFSFWNHD